MTEPTNAAPQFGTLTPAIAVRNAAGAIEFYKQAFGAEEHGRSLAPDGTRILHAVLRFGESYLMLSDEFPEFGGCKAPQSLGGTTSTLHLNVADADVSFQRAVDAGATVTMPLDNMFWGDRYGKLVDPFGHEWSIGAHIEDVSEEEMQRRMQQAFSAPANA
jgi:PhnB protein